MQREIVDDLIYRIESSVKEPDPTRALVHIEEAKKLLQECYYKLWIAYHNRKTNGSTS